jgi:hypothetical protein
MAEPPTGQTTPTGQTDYPPGICFFASISFSPTLT